MGRLYIVGIGPGDGSYLTGAARSALDAAEEVWGYTLYIDLLTPLFPGKAMRSAPMGGELDRCRRALRTAQSGRTCALVCGGDAGVYGLAAPALELAPRFPEADIEIVPGVTAALAGAALLGAPLGHDFCVLSLSDLLTPWEIIERRLRCAAEGDFSLCLYNPASHKRRDGLRRACGILLEYRDAGTVCGLARNIGRPGQGARLLSLSELREAEVDMFTTVFVGSSTSRNIGGRMVTPRGYRIP